MLDWAGRCSNPSQTGSEAGWAKQAGEAGHDALEGVLGWTNQVGETGYTKLEESWAWLMEGEAGWDKPKTIYHSQ